MCSTWSWHLMFTTCTAKHVTAIRQHYFMLFHKESKYCCCRSQQKYFPNTLNAFLTFCSVARFLNEIFHSNFNKLNRPTLLCILFAFICNNICATLRSYTRSSSVPGCVALRLWNIYSCLCEFCAVISAIFTWRAGMVGAVGKISAFQPEGLWFDPGSTEIWIFVWPSFLPKLTQLSILPG